MKNRQPSGWLAFPAFRRCILLMVAALLLLMAGTAFVAATSSRAGPGGEGRPSASAEVATVTPGPASEPSVESTRVEPSENSAPSEAPTPTPTAPLAPTPAAQPTSTLPVTIAIDPGHGGPDAGGSHRNAAGVVDLTEKEANLAIAIRLAELLRADGYQVVLTREADKAVNDSPQDWTGDGQINSRDELQARVDIANAAGARVFVSIHNNGSSSPGQSGTEVWWSPDRPFADDNFFLATQAQAAILKRLADAGYRSVDRGTKSDHAFRIWR
ncbi:MAG: N-acetylmuramoyl-L-alanine amidase, partial [Chloroflexi bacterium]|nr:N-acetylmuramoyl-L-alanine amidase [Chloroflexota bacterium]